MKEKNLAKIVGIFNEMAERLDKADRDGVEPVAFAVFRRELNDAVNKFLATA